MALTTEKDLPPNARSLWLKALSAFELKNYGYAISLLQGVLAESPGFLQGRQVLRKAAIANTRGKKGFLSSLSGASLSGMKTGGLVKKDPMEAMRAAEKLLEVDPGSSSANHLLKEAALASDYPEIAAFALETLREANPKDTKVMHELAQHYSQFEQPEKAVEIYNAILVITPNDIAAVKGGKDASARLSMQSGGWTTASNYRDLIQNKEQAELLEQQNRVVKDEDVIEAQLADLSLKYEQDNTNVEVVRKIAGLYETKDDLHTALEWYRYAVALTKNTDPGLVRKSMDLGVKLLDGKIRGIAHWLSEHDENDPEHVAKAAEYEALRRERAELLLSDARRRVEKNPTDLQLQYELGEVLVLAGQYKEAMPVLQRARQSPNARLRALSLLGQCMVKLGMLDLAENQFKTAVAEITTMDDTKKDLLYNLGLVYEMDGKKEEYIECMKRIYETDFGYRDVAQRVEDSYK